jgi:pimeloyl-ACP methyl ester carboxylesterase
MQHTPAGVKMLYRLILFVYFPTHEELPMATVTILENEIYYEISGEGPPLIMLHNGFYSGATWDGVRDELSRQYTVVTYDRAGYGRSTKSDFGVADDIVEEGVAELALLLEHLGYDQVNLLGHCLGGAIALLYTARNPDRVLKTIAEAVGYFGDHRSLMKADMTFVPWDTIPPELKEVLQEMHGEEYAPRFWDIISRHDSSYIMSEQYDIRKEVKSIKTPLFIMNGDRDYYFEPEIPVGVFRRRRNTRLWIAPVCGHDMHIEKRDAFIRETLQFLDEKPDPQ